jgi:hypothetical protein
MNNCPAASEASAFWYSADTVCPEDVRIPKFVPVRVTRELPAVGKADATTGVVVVMLSILGAVYDSVGADSVIALNTPPPTVTRHFS